MATMKTQKYTTASIKTPKFQVKIHVPALPGAFTFRKNGKLRLDQQVKKFCLLNKVRGCLEVLVHFGVHTNPAKINYDAKPDAMYIDTLGDQQKWQLRVPYPLGLKVSIPANPEAQFFCGKLSCKLAIVSYDKALIVTDVGKKKQRKAEAAVSAEMADDSKMVHTKRKLAMREKRKEKRAAKKARRAMIRSGKLSMGDLNKRIAMSQSQKRDLHSETENVKESAKVIVSVTAKEKRKMAKEKKEAKKRRQRDAAHELIDGVVDEIELKVRERRAKEVERDEDVREYQKQRTLKKREKESKKQALWEKFQQRRKKKKNSMRKEQSSWKKKVTFAGGV